MKTLARAVLMTGSLAMARAEEPQWLTDARSAEGSPGDLHQVTTSDKQVSFSVPVPLQGDILEQPTFYEVVLKLSPTASAACDIYKEDIDIAQTIRLSADNTFASVIEPAQGKIERKAIERIDTLMVGATPVLTVSWVYRANDGKAARVGGLRLYAAARGGHGVYCALNELGYSKTFEQVVRALVDTLTPAEDYKAPYYREVSIASVKGVRLGYFFVDLRHDDDGDTQENGGGAVLLAKSPESLQALDLVQIEWAHADGTFINGSQIVSANGELEVNLRLLPKEPGGWMVQGKFRGKDINEEIATGAPSTWLGHTKLLKDLLGTDKPVGKEALSVQWLSSDPGRFTEFKVKVLAAVNGKTYTVRETTSSTSSDSVVEAATGQVLSGTFEFGPLQISSERVYVQGTP